MYAKRVGATLVVALIQGGASPAPTTLTSCPHSIINISVYLIMLLYQYKIKKTR